MREPRATSDRAKRTKVMKVALDAVGRLPIPKPLRRALGLKPGQPLEIRVADGRLEIEIAHPPMRIRKRGKGVVLMPATGRRTRGAVHRNFRSKTPSISSRIGDERKTRTAPA